jgi:hypothetical protein
MSLQTLMPLLIKAKSTMDAVVREAEQNALFAMEPKLEPIINDLNQIQVLDEVTEEEKL